jgi:hypothetical protein
VNRLVGYGSAAAALLIMFLPVSADLRVDLHLSCGPGWYALFAHANNSNFDCGAAAFPHLWIAGAVAGAGWAHRAAGSGRLLAVIGCVVVLVVFIAAAALAAFTWWTPKSQ